MILVISIALRILRGSGTEDSLAAVLAFLEMLKAVAISAIVLNKHFPKNYSLTVLQGVPYKDPTGCVIIDYKITVVAQKIQKL